MHPRIHTRVRIHVILRVRHDVLVPCVCHHVRAIFIQEIILNVPQINESRPSCVSLRPSGTNRRDISRWRRLDRSVHQSNYDESPSSFVRIVRTCVTGGRYSRKCERAITDAHVRNLLLSFLATTFRNKTWLKIFHSLKIYSYKIHS